MSIIKINLAILKYNLIQLNYSSTIISLINSLSILFQS